MTKEMTPGEIVNMMESLINEAHQKLNERSGQRYTTATMEEPSEDTWEEYLVGLSEECWEHVSESYISILDSLGMLDGLVEIVYEWAIDGAIDPTERDKAVMNFAFAEYVRENGL